MEVGDLKQHLPNIPEFYYDVIGRIPAGTLLVLFFLWASGAFGTGGVFESATVLKELAWAAAVFLLILLFVTAYALSLLLTPTGSLLTFLFRPFLWKRMAEADVRCVEKFITNEQLGIETPFLAARKCPGVWKWLSTFWRPWELRFLEEAILNTVARRDAKAHRVLLKMRAEALLCENLFAVMVVCGLCAGARVHLPALQRLASSKLTDSWPLFVAGILLISIAGYLRNRRYLRRMLIHLRAGGPDSEATEERDANLLYECDPVLATKRTLFTAAKPDLEALSKHVLETVHMACLDGNMLLYLAKISSPAPGARMDSFPGSITSVGARRHYVHCSALGKLLAALENEEDRTSFLKSLHLHKYTERTILDVARLGATLEQIGRDCYACDREEVRDGMYCIAAPIMQNGVAIAAISVSTSASRFDHEEEWLRKRVCEAAKQISTKCGQV